MFVSALFAVSLFAGLSSAGNGPGADVATEEDAVAKWSVLVYLVADNNLDEYTETDLVEFEVGGSSEEVNVLILMDKLYEPAVLMTIVDHERVVLEELGELNMGDPANLRYLIEYSDENYPAEHMLVFFWDHGSGVHGVCVDETMEDGTAGSDWLSHHETIEAIEGHPVDIMAADECSIGQMETIYEYHSKGADIDYWIASESYIGWRGFSYDEILLSLNDDPDMAARELS
ncbi:MAG: clostripain-related cysteine peptidase, partial [Thermoplasmata archaeon]